MRFIFKICEVGHLCLADPDIRPNLHHWNALLFHQNNAKCILNGYTLDVVGTTSQPDRCTYIRAIWHGNNAAQYANAGLRRYRRAVWINFSRLRCGSFQCTLCCTCYESKELMGGRGAEAFWEDKIAKGQECEITTKWSRMLCKEFCWICGDVKLP